VTKVIYTSKNQSPFMSLDNKKFRNNRTGEIVKVISTFEDIAVLENKQKASVNELTNPALFTEEVDPSSFFSNQSAFNQLAEKIRNIPTHMIQDDDGQIPVTSTTNDQFRPLVNESAVIMTTEEDERAELARKYGASIDNTSTLARQNDAFAKILGEDSEEELPVVPIVFDEPEVQRVEVNRNTPQVQRVEVEDPIVTMFKRTKRNVEFKINVEVSDKIPRLDFIEMMEDSYEISMIDFLADEFTNKILQDPSSIRESIKDKIKQLVYGAPISHISTTNKEEISTDEDSKDISSINAQITDAVTQFKKDVSFDEKTGEVKTEKPKTTRKPRTKKETAEND
jgi:hypothetical protein